MHVTLSWSHDDIGNLVKYIDSVPDSYHCIKKIQSQDLVKIKLVYSNNDLWECDFILNLQIRIESTWAPPLNLLYEYEYRFSRKVKKWFSKKVLKSYNFKKSLKS